MKRRNTEDFKKNPDIEKVGHNVAENANRTTRRGERRGSNYAFFRDSGNQVSSIREFKTRT